MAALGLGLGLGGQTKGKKRNTFLIWRIDL